MTMLQINGKATPVDAPDDMPLLWVLRDHLGMTGTKFGCGASQCGACTVHLNGEAVKSCTTLALSADGAEVLTIEGLAPADAMHPMQQAFGEHHGLQCGYCTPGMIMTALDMVRRLGNDLDEHTIRHELEGSICRCTGYHNIVKAIAAGALVMNALPSPTTTANRSEG